MFINVIHIATIFIILKSATAPLVKETQTQIKDLEKRKNELFRQINEAIDDSAKILKFSNDTDSKLTLNYMEELRRQIRELNATEDNDDKRIENEIEDGTMSEVDKKYDNSTDVRRYGSLTSNRNPKIKLDLADVVELLKKRGDTSMVKKTKEEIANQIRIESKLYLWMIEKQKERELIEGYRYKQRLPRMKFERCPAQGLGKQKKKKSRRTDVNKTEDGKPGCNHTRDYKTTTKKVEKEKTTNTRKSRKKLYPCCRKCCKRSYMGCL